MPLIKLWETNAKAVKELRIEQIVATAGDGHLKDNSECQTELRDFLRQVSVEKLSVYSDYCLTKSFNNSGFVLQDIVNELGRRLEYEVTNGLYRGVINQVGFDGLWLNPSGNNLLVEVKTTDTYRLSLDTIASYMKKSLSEGYFSPPCSILIVVGRIDTGELEAQVRGSRHAWDIRLISVDSLINLVKIKESADFQETITKIRKLLTPIEYTRIDELVDVVFTTAQDVETAASSEINESDTEMSITEKVIAKKNSQKTTPKEIIKYKRESIVEAVGKKLNTVFINKSRATYWNADHSIRIACAVSKRYSNSGNVKYWYAYHPNWDLFLSEGKIGEYVLGCTDLDIAFSMPVDLIREHLSSFNITEKKDGKFYYHIKILEPAPGDFQLQLPKENSDLPLEPYKVPLDGGV
jgi:hypothetical protein